MKNIIIIMISIFLFSCGGNIKQKNAAYKIWQDKYYKVEQWDIQCNQHNDNKLNQTYNNIATNLDFSVVPLNEFNLLWEDYCDCTFNAAEKIEYRNDNNIYLADNLRFTTIFQKDCYLEQVAFKIFRAYLWDKRDVSQFKNLSNAQFEGLIRCQFYSNVRGSDPKECFCEPEIRIEYVDREVIVEKKVEVQRKEKATIDQQIQIFSLGFGVLKWLLD